MSECSYFLCGLPRTERCEYASSGTGSMTNSRDVNEKARLLQQSHPKGFRVQGSIFLGFRVEDFLESRFGSFGVSGLGLLFRRAASIGAPPSCSRSSARSSTVMEKPRSH